MWNGRVTGSVVLALAVASVVLPLDAAQRTFVASYGVDTQTCSRAAPCRSFAAAMAHTDPAGEVVVLDSAGYGPVTVAQAVSIIAPPGVYAGVSVFVGNGITVNAGAGNRVVIRGLTINFQGGFGNGIVVNSGSVVSIEGCVVDGFPTGIDFHPSIVTRLRIVDSAIRNNFGAGIAAFASAGSEDSTLEIDRTTSTRNGSGVTVGSISRTTIANSWISRNSSYGVRVQSPLADSIVSIYDSQITGNLTGVSVGTAGELHFTEVTITGSAISNNSGTGIAAVGPLDLVYIGRNQIAGNTTAASEFAGSFTTMSNNMRVFNTSDGNATPNPILPY